MDVFLALKFLHVVSAVAWLGGGLALLILATAQTNKSDPQRLIAVIAQVAFLGQRLFMPASILTLLTGLLAVYFGGFGWPAWVVLGLGGIAVTSVLGAVKLGPTSARILTIAKTGGADAARTEALGLLRLVRFDYVLQFAIVFLMVVKPDWQDVQVLAGMALAVLLGSFLVLAPMRRSALGF